MKQLISNTAKALLSAATCMALATSLTPGSTMAHPHKDYTLRLNPSCGFEVVDLSPPAIEPFGLTTGLEMAYQGARIIRIREMCPWDLDHLNFQFLPQNNDYLPQNNDLKWGPIPPLPPIQN